MSSKQELFEQGISVLMGGFGTTMTALFEPAPVGSLEENPFSKLELPEQATLSQSALTTVLGQSIAANALMFGLSKDDALNHSVSVLAQYVEIYYEKFKEDIKDAKANMGKGLEAGDGLLGKLPNK